MGCDGKYSPSSQRTLTNKITKHPFLTHKSSEAMERLQSFKKLNIGEAGREVEKLSSVPKHELTPVQSVMATLDLALLRHLHRGRATSMMRHSEALTEIAIKEDITEESVSNVAPAIANRGTKDKEHFGRGDIRGSGDGATHGQLRVDAGGMEEEVEEEKKEAVEGSSSFVSDEASEEGDFCFENELAVRTNGSLPSPASLSASSSSPRSSVESESGSITVSVPSSDPEEGSGKGAIADPQIEHKNKTAPELESPSSIKEKVSALRAEESEPRWGFEQPGSCQCTYALAKYRRHRSGFRCAWKTGVVLAGSNESQHRSIYCVQISSLELEVGVRGASVERSFDTSGSRGRFPFMIVCEGDRILRFVAPSHKDCKAWVESCIESRREGPQRRENVPSKPQAKTKWWPSAVTEGLVYQGTNDLDDETLRFVRVVATHGKLIVQVFGTSEVELVDESLEDVCNYAWKKKSFKFTFDVGHQSQEHVLRMGTYLVMRGRAAPSTEMHFAPLIRDQLQEVLNEYECYEADQMSVIEANADTEDNKSDAEVNKGEEFDSFSFEADLPIQVIPLREEETTHSFGQEPRSPKVVPMDDEDRTKAGRKIDPKGEVGMVHAGPDKITPRIEVDETDRQMCGLREELLRQVKGMRHKRVMKKNGQSYAGDVTPRLSNTQTSKGSALDQHEKSTIPEHASEAVLARLQRTMKTTPPNQLSNSRGPRKLPADVLSGLSTSHGLTKEAGEQGEEQQIAGLSSAVKQGSHETEDDDEFEDCVEERSPLELPKQEPILAPTLSPRKSFGKGGNDWMMVCKRGRTMRQCEFDVIGQPGNMLLKCSYVDDSIQSRLINLSETYVVRNEPSSCLLNALVAYGSEDEDICVKSMTNSFKTIVSSSSSVTNTFEFYYTGAASDVDQFIERLSSFSYS